MSKRSSVASLGANGSRGPTSSASSQPGMWSLISVVDLATTNVREAIDKQKTLLSADVGHFSLVRAMHLADLITLMNGMCLVVSCHDGSRFANVEVSSSFLRLLRRHVHLFVSAILPR